MMAEQIEQTVGEISEMIKGINSMFDMVRHLLRELEKTLNQMGNPGIDFQGETPFICTCSKRGVLHRSYYMAFESGKILIILVIEEKWAVHKGGEKVADFVSETHKFPFSNMALSDVGRMLKWLPYFLNQYSTFLELKHQDDQKENIEKLDQIIDAIKKVVN